MAERVGAVIGAIPAVLLWCACAGAAELRDPTRPPGPSQTVRSDGPAAVAPVARLTAIRIDAGQRVAVIGGERLQVGDVLGDARIRIIRNTEVVLSTPAGPRVLKLYPGVQQQAHRNTSRDTTRIARAPTASVKIEGGADQGKAPVPSHGDSTQ